MWVQEADAAEQEKLNKIIDDKVQARLKEDPASTTNQPNPHDFSVRSTSVVDTLYLSRECRV